MEKLEALANKKNNNLTPLKWVKRVKNKEFRKKLLTYYQLYPIRIERNVRVNSLKEAIRTLFVWNETPEGIDYWNRLYNNPEKLEALANKKTMKLEKLEKQYQKLGEEIAKLKEEKKELWERDSYVLTGIGEVYNEKQFPSASPEFKKQFYQQGRLFRTKEEAEKFLEKERLLAEISREDGVKSFVQFEDNYTFAYHNMWLPSLQTVFNYPTNIYFETGQQVKKVIDKYGDRLNILL